MMIKYHYHAGLLPNTQCVCVHWVCQHSPQALPQNTGSGGSGGGECCCTGSHDLHSEVNFTVLVGKEGWGGGGGGEREGVYVWEEGGLFVGCLLNVPATCECISGTDLLRQFYVLPH